MTLTKADTKISGMEYRTNYYIKTFVFEFQHIWTHKKDKTFQWIVLTVSVCRRMK